MVTESDMSPRLRFALEFVAVVCIVMTLSGIAVRKMMHLYDRAIVVESFALAEGNRTDSVLAYAETGLWTREATEPESGSFGLAQLQTDGSTVVTFGDAYGSSGLRGRKVVLSLRQSSPWTSNVFSWTCRSPETAAGGIEPASLPETCKE